MLTEPITNLYSQNCVICLKVGIKYSSEYVNNLYQAVRKQCDWDFLCFTDDPSGIDLGVICHSIGPRDAEGWWAAWNKVEIMGREEIKHYKKKVFFDLDLVIQGDITPILEHDHEWSLIRCTWKGIKYRMEYPGQPIHTSCCMVWKDLVWLYELWESNWETIVKNNAGADVWYHRKKLPHTALPDVFYSYREGYRPKHYWENNYKPNLEYMPDFAVCTFHQKPELHELDHDNILYKIWNDPV